MFKPEECSVIRMTADRADIDEVMYINKRTFKRPWKRDRVRRFVKSPKNFGLLVKSPHHGGMIIGFALCAVKPDRLYIGLLAINGYFRCFGLGTMLVRAVQKEMETFGKKQVDLHMYSKDEAPRLLYLKTGFRIVEEIPGFYPDGVSAYRMIFEQPNIG